MSANDQTKKINKKIGQGFDPAEMKMEELARLVVTMSPDHEKYERIVNEIKLRTKGIWLRAEEKNTINGATKGIPAKSAFRRAPEEELVNAEVPSARGADVVRLLKEADPDSAEYIAYIDFLKANAPGEPKEDARKWEQEGDRKGSMAERIQEEVLIPPAAQKTLQERILSIAYLLPVERRGDKRELIEIAQEVSLLEFRLEQIKKIARSS